MYFHIFASSGLRCWLRQIPEERAGVQIQQKSPGASVHLQELLGQNVWRTQAPPGVQSWSVQGAAEIRCRGGDLLHGFGDGWGKTGLSSEGCFLIWAARWFNCSSRLRPLDGSRVSPRAQRAFLQSWIRRHQQLSLSGENGQEGWDRHLLLQVEALIGEKRCSGFEECWKQLFLSSVYSVYKQSQADKKTHRRRTVLRYGYIY